MSQHKSQLRGGMLLASYFTHDYQDNVVLQKNILVEALARSGKQYGYFVTDEQHDRFIHEFGYILTHKYCSLNIVAMQQLLRDNEDEANDSLQPNALCVLYMEKYVTSDGVVDTSALEASIRAMTLACDIFQAAVPNSTGQVKGSSITVECADVWYAAKILAMNDDSNAVEAQATALGACVMGYLYAASIAIAQHIAPYRDFVAQQGYITETIQGARDALKDLNASLVSEDFLSAIVTTWDAAVEGCRKYGTRSRDIIVMSIEKPSGTAPAAHNHTDITEQAILSKSYTFSTKSDASVAVVALQHEDGSLKQIICSTNDLNKTHEMLLCSLFASISIGITEGVPLSEYVRSFVGGEMQLDSALQEAQLIEAILYRLALDFLDSETLTELGIRGNATDQLTLLEVDAANPVLTDKPCRDCGAAVSRVGKYYICMECGSAAD